MAFTAIQISFLQRLVDERPPSRQSSAAASYFSEHFSLGRVAGSRVEYTDAHFAAAERLLVANRLPVRALGAAATRAQAAEYGGMSEKDFSVAPHANSVAVTRYGTVEATVDVVTADAVTDEKKGSYYPAILTLNQKDMDIDGKRVPLSPGMSLTAEIKTGKRRVIEYLLSPVQRAGSESLRER
ncbi:MAG: hypothetical protein U1E04_13200 [Hylemonella sp.]|nr:hypothetical protein [Hylemonella sp.]